MLSLFPLLAAVTLASAFVVVPAASDHDHALERRLPTTWYHRDDHPVHALFKRAPDEGASYATVGSSTWSATFPASTPIASNMPKAWIDALNQAVAANTIPDIPRSKNFGDSDPTYPDGNDPTGETVCSATYKCQNEGDIWDAPDGLFASSFDDGPLPPTTALVDFLQSNDEKTTHFMIGLNIIENPTQFLQAFNASHDIAVHTWTHPYMTTLSNLDVVAELGWTMELIHNSTEGRVPKFWRPPYGDSDNRVRAIAEQVFGLTTVIWNQDTDDWSIGEAGGTTPDAVGDHLQTWLSGPKTPGLIVLEHELTDDTVNAFIKAYPSIKSNGWNFVSLAQMGAHNSTDAYQNSQSSTSSVNNLEVVDAGNYGASTASPSATSTSLSQASSPSSNTSSSAGPSPSVHLQSGQKSSATALVPHCGSGWSTSVFGLLVAAVSSFMI